MGSASGEMFARHRIASGHGVDEAREALSEVFLPVDFPSARASGRVDLRLNALTVGRITCGYMEFGDAVQIQTAEPENYHVDIPTAGRATMRAGLGSPIYGTRSTAGMFMPGRPVEIDSGSSRSSCTASCSPTAHSHNYSAALTAAPPSAGMRPVARAVELLRESPEHPWTVSELAARSAVGVRSLQEGFRRSLDTTPMAYLRRVRLQRVHEQLAAAEPGTVSVTEVASRWGFVHLGRFSEAYRREFSERPSETARRHPLP